MYNWQNKQREEGIHSEKMFLYSSFKRQLFLSCLTLQVKIVKRETRDIFSLQLVLWKKSRIMEEATKEAFHQLNMRLETVQVAEQSIEEIAKMVKQNDGRYTYQGGNTFYFLQELKAWSR
ncbi:Type 1 glutamine amidotransferase-like domain-containing protein [Bacillus sp. SL00103]